MREDKPKHWLEPVLDSIEDKHPEGKIILSSGIAPSAGYHIGHLREILSVDLLYVGLKLRGREVVHYHVIDNIDPLRKRYDFLPEEYENYVGWPVALVPAEDGISKSYADQHVNEFQKAIEPMHMEFEIINSFTDLYGASRMGKYIDQSLEKIGTIKKIFKETTNRDLDDSWTPVQLIGDDNKMFNGDLSTWDKSAGTLDGIDYRSGRAKLNWRLDWPARWAELGVMVEPHGFQEHGAAGGSYETGCRFAREVFEIEPPMAGIQYGHVHLPGDKFKMSSSKNNYITPAQTEKIMPIEAIRYFYARYPGKKRIDFDPGLGLLRMLDEFSQVDQAIRSGQDHQFAPAYKIATYYSDGSPMSSVPFSHLVSVYQAALGDPDKIFEALKRTEYRDIVDDQKDQISHELKYVENWLNDWAPDEVKFVVQQELPNAKLSEEQKHLLGDLANRIEQIDGPIDGQKYHELIYESKEEAGLDPKSSFQAIYRVVLNKDFGPKAGWFLSILDKDFLIRRFRFEA